MHLGEKRITLWYKNKKQKKKKLTSRGIARWWRDESWGRFVNRQGVDESKTQKEDGMKN